jgi:hypothetical protein
VARANMPAVRISGGILDAVTRTDRAPAISANVRLAADLEVRLRLTLVAQTRSRIIAFCESLSSYGQFNLPFGPATSITRSLLPLGSLSAVAWCAFNSCGTALQDWRYL